MNKYFTDKQFLLNLLEETDTKVKVEILATCVDDEWHKERVGKTIETDKDSFYKIVVPYDLDHPLTETKHTGHCYCDCCGGEIGYGEEIIEYDGMQFCCYECLDSYIESCSVSREVTESDLIDDEVLEVPMFDYKEL